MEPPTAVPKHYVTLVELPTRVLQRILLQCDNDILFQLSQTCRPFNTIALTHFFDRNRVRSPSHGSLDINYDVPDILKATRFALFTPHTLTEITFLFPRPASFVEKVEELTQLLSRLHHVRHVNLHFWDMDTPIIEDRPASNRHQSSDDHLLDRRAWLVPLQGLLSCALGKGCAVLGVWCLYRMWCLDHEWCPKAYPKLYRPVLGGEEGVSPSSTLVQDVQVAKEPGDKSLRKTFTSIPRRIISKFHNKRPITMDGQGGPLDSVDTPTTQFPPRNTEGELVRFDVHARILLEDPLIDWTLSSLAASAGTLSKLSFRIPYVADAIWHRVLNSLTLPHLSELMVVVDPSVHEVLQQFLARHPSIQILGLECLCLSHSATILPHLTIPILPNLVTLVAHPCYITWLLTLIASDRNSLPQLSSVTITSKHILSFRSVPYETFDGALQSVVETQREISLGLCLASRTNLDVWMQRDINTDIIQRHLSTVTDNAQRDMVNVMRVTSDLGLPLPLPWPPTTLAPVSFVHIKNLVLSSGSLLGCLFEEAVLRLFPAWLNLFPSLVSLRMIGGSWMIKDRLAFEQSLADGCPRLKKLFYSSYERDPGIDLDELRLSLADGGGSVSVLDHSDPIGT